MSRFEKLLDLESIGGGTTRERVVRMRDGA